MYYGSKEVFEDMMKGYKKIFVVFLLISCFLINVCSVQAKEASTLAELRGELKALENKKKDTANKKALTNNQIKDKNNAIIDANNKISESEENIAQAKKDIEATDEKIKELDAQTKELMNFYQQMMSNNSYLEFISESSSMTELVMRMDAVVQVTNFNKKKLSEMEDLIKDNEQKQVDLKNYEKELEGNIQNYQKALTSLHNDLASLNEIGMDLDDEIRSKKELIKSYEDMGCKENQDLNACMAMAGNNTWLKPFNKGKVNSIFGVRKDPFTGKNKVHQAVDIGGNPEGTNVLSIGNGVVIASVNARAKSGKTCGGNQLYIKYVIKGETYTVLYAHLLSMNVKVGDKVNSTTVIGQQGGGPKTQAWESCSTGTHLHLQISKTDTASYGTFTAKSIVPPGYPKKGGWWYNRYQYF